MMRPGSPCGIHRPVLVDLVDHGERGPGTAAALDHLDACPACEHEVTEIALTIAALRRAGAAYRALPGPRAVLPPRPSRRGRGARWSWRFQLGSLVTGAGIAAILVASRVGFVPTPPLDAAPAVSRPAAVVTWQAAEHRLASSPDTASVAAVGSVPPRYPDGLLRPWKEVPATDATARVFEPR